jgi:hypothetical protein
MTLTINLEPAAANVTVLVDGQGYSTDENGTLDVIDLDGANSFNVTVPTVAPVGTGSRIVFEQWSNGANSTTVNLQYGADVTAIYQLQFYVAVNTIHGTPSGVGWYDQGATATIALPGTINDTQPGTRYAFMGWQGIFNETSNPVTFEVETPTNLTASWSTQYYLDVDTGGHAVASGSGWYDAGSNATYSLSPPNPVNGSWYIFQGWSGDCLSSNLTGTINVTEPMKLTADWTVLEWMTITFVDATGQEVNSSRALTAQLLAPNGTTIQLDQNRISGTWLMNGTYLVSDAITLGLDVSLPGQSFTTTPNGEAKIPLALYPLTFRIHDMITSRSISGVVITLTLPDGSTESNITGTDGTAAFQELPVSSYTYEANGNWVVQTTGNATINSDEAMKLDIGIIYVPSIIVTVLSAIAIAAVSAILVRRRRRTNSVAITTNM